MTFGEIIYKVRTDKGMTQDELAHAVGYKSRSSIAKIESGERDASQSMIAALAKALDTSPSALMGWDNDTNLSLTAQPQFRGINVLDKNNIYMIPIFKSVSAGFGAYADDQICGYEPIYLESKREAEETIAIAVRGDSMYPKIEEDDLVVVHKQDYFENGDIVVAVVCGENDGFVKRAFQTEEKLTLESINPSYPPMIFSGSKLDDIKIMGVVKKIIKSV
ncbi:LexA family protein [Ruminococcus flavefaciens]|uniref:LexA family protein n=1 Tax=Ruminococcus flavefaciens TaxID=1265 RepID=UPI0002D70010|nr:XRE family transcriptional regulator [Ruminococcus flavefaciens]